MIVSIHQPQYWPWLGLIDKIRNSDLHVILDDVQFNWRAFQHRTLIRAANRQHQQYIQVPYVKSTKRGPINQVQIDYGRKYLMGSWQDETIRLLELNYGSSPYFKEVMDAVTNVVCVKGYSSLAALNTEILRVILELFEIQTTLIPASDLKSDKQKDELMLDLTIKAGGDTYLSGMGAKAYMNNARFREHGVDVMYQQFNHPVYDQHREPFVAGLSCLDVLFNLGPRQASELMQAGLRQQLQEVVS